MQQRKYSLLRPRLATVDISRQLSRLKDHNRSNKLGTVELSVQTLPLNHLYLYIIREINKISDFYTWNR